MEQLTTLECLLAQKNHHIRRHIQRLGTQSNYMIGLIHKSSVTIK